jgi:hypothetical protein
MSDTTTANYGWTKPAVGGSDNTWGTKTNTNWDGVDATVFGVSQTVNQKLNLSGGTLTGALVLSGNASAALNPVPLQQMNAALPVASSTTPIMDGTAAVGTGTTWARADHVHPTDTALWANIRYRNRVINGDMSVDQRNGGAGTSPASPGAYIIDRWKFFTNITPAKGGLSQTVNSPAFYPYPSFLYWATASTSYTVAAADYFFLAQTIEWANFSDAMWGTASAQPVTLEFWAASSVAGTFGGCVRNAAFNRSYVFTYTLAANTWTKVRINLPGDTAGTWAVTPGSAAALQLVFTIASGASSAAPAGSWGTSGITAPGTVNLTATANATLYITGVGLMVGSAASNAEPEFRKFSDNLIDCQRYYEKGYSYSVVPGATGQSPSIFAYMVSGSAVQYTAGGQVAFKVIKRGSPTVTMYSYATGAAGKINDAMNGVDVTANSNGVNDQSFGWSAANANAIQGGYNFQGQWTADADF